MSDSTESETVKHDGTFNELTRNSFSYGNRDYLAQKYGNTAAPNILCITEVGGRNEAVYFPLSKDESKNILGKIAQIGVAYAANPSKEIQKLTKFDDISDMFSKFAQIATAVKTNGNLDSSTYQGRIFASPDLKEYPIVSSENFGGNNTPLEFDLKFSLGDADLYDFNLEILEPLAFFLRMLPSPDRSGGWDVPLPTSMDIITGLVNNIANNSVFDTFASSGFSILELGKTNLVDTFNKISSASQEIKTSLTNLLWKDSHMKRFIIEIGNFSNVDNADNLGFDYQFYPYLVSRKMGISKIDFEWSIDQDRPVIYNGKKEKTIAAAREGYLPNTVTVKLSFKPLATVGTSDQLYHPIRVV